MGDLGRRSSGNQGGVYEGGCKEDRCAVGEVGSSGCKVVGSEVGKGCVVTPEQTKNVGWGVSVQRPGSVEGVKYWT